MARMLFESGRGIWRNGESRWPYSYPIHTSPSIWTPFAFEAPHARRFSGTIAALASWSLALVERPNKKPCLFSRRFAFPSLLSRSLCLTEVPIATCEASFALWSLVNSPSLIGTPSKASIPTSAKRKAQREQIDCRQHVEPDLQLTLLFSSEQQRPLLSSLFTR